MVFRQLSLKKRLLSQVIIAAAILAVCRGAAGGVVPVGVGVAAPYGYGRPLGVAAPLAVARPVALARPALAAPYAAPVDEYDPNPQYSYAYDIQDALTGESE